MSRPEPNEPPVEQDSRFPSGPWLGFFLQPTIAGRHKMELHLTFRNGMLRGEGRDRVGAFLIVGRYDVADGKCHWTKRYLGQHDIHYRGFNEGKGIWGMWEYLPAKSYWKGGFHIWPEAMGDPSAVKLAEAIEEPLGVPVEAMAEEALTP